MSAPKLISCWARLPPATAAAAPGGTGTAQVRHSQPGWGKRHRESSLKLFETLLTARCAAVPRWQEVVLSQSLAKLPALCYQLCPRRPASSLMNALSPRQLSRREGRTFLYIQCKHSPCVGAPTAVIVEYINISITEIWPPTDRFTHQKLEELNCSYKPQNRKITVGSCIKNAGTW